VREEAYYFAPQGQTKIMNEGWASYWHSTIMTTKALKDHEILDYADHHSGTMATQQGKLNPYKLGIELFRDIEERWNKGRFGKEWDECDDLRARRCGTSWRRAKCSRCASTTTITFIDTFLTPEFAMDQKLFVYGFNDKRNSWEILDREFRKVKAKLLQQLTNFGQPIIEVVRQLREPRQMLLAPSTRDRTSRATTRARP
jgi:stage V sporulation protein R